MKSTKKQKSAYLWPIHDAVLTMFFRAGQFEVLLLERAVQNQWLSRATWQPSHEMSFDTIYTKTVSQAPPVRKAEAKNTVLYTEVSSA